MRLHTRQFSLRRRWLAAAAIVATATIAGGRETIVGQQAGGSALDFANKGKVAVQIVGAAPGLTIEIALNGGKIADTAITTNGTGTSVLDVANLGKTQAQVWIEICENGKRVRVLIYTSGGQPPDDENCRRRALGYFWTDRAKTIKISVAAASMNVDSAGGLSGKEIVGYVVLPAAGATTGVLVAGRNSAPAAQSAGSPVTVIPPVTTPPAVNTTPPAPTNPTTPPTTPTTPPFAFLVNKTYNNMITRGRADCAGFSASASTQLRFTGIDPQTGRGTFVHVHSGTTTLNYTVQDVQRTGDTNFTIVGTGTVMLGTTTYQLRITIMINGNTDSKVEEFSCGAGQMTVYTGSGSSQ
jgi:hypothetical protein